MSSLRSVISLAAAACIVGAYSAHAQTPAAPAAPPPPKHPIFSSPIGDIQISGHTELGLSINPDSPANNANFGQPFTNGANAFRMNQTMLTVEHDTDSSATGFDYGFKFQTFYGTDARYTHFYNELDRATNSPYQMDINYLEANIHAPAMPVVSGGSDWQVGQYATPLGYEVIDATGNPFYSHSYIFTYGLPYKHTGVLGTFHINDTIDVWAGWDTGVNDSLGSKGVNNASLAHGILGFGLNNLMDGNLTLIALAHVGAENPTGSTTTVNGVTKAFNVNSALREYFDANGTYKINDSWTTTTEVNLVHDDVYKVTAGGVAQYVSYALNDQWTLGGRIEGFADQIKNGFAGFVCNNSGSEDATDGGRGLVYSNENTKNPTMFSQTTYCGNVNNGLPANITYGELTIGAAYTPPLPLPGTWGLTIRPEARFDSIIGGSAHVAPYNVSNKGVGTKSNQITLAVDALLAF